MPQQRRAQVTRRVILVAAAEEFDRAGYDATPLSSILRRSGVTKGAFYFHFASKEVLASTLVQLQNQCWQHLWRTWMRCERDPLSIAIGMVDEATRLVDDDVVIRAGMTLGRHPALLGRTGRTPAPDCERLLAELFQRSAKDGLLRADVDPLVSARVLYAAMVGAYTLGAERRAGVGVAARVAEVWWVLLRGIASADWLRRNPQPRTPG